MKSRPRIYFPHKAPETAFLTPLHGDTAVIACHFNPCGYARPVGNLRKFLNMCAADAVPLFMAELTFRGGVSRVLPESPRVAHFETDPGNMLFQKEALLNAAESLVPSSFRKILWLDADILLTNRDWLRDASAIITGRVQVGSPFTRCIWTDEAGKETAVSSATGKRLSVRCSEATDWTKSFPGFGGIASRRLWKEFGGLYAHAVGGHGDSLFWLAAANKADFMNPITAAMGNASRLHWLKWAQPVAEWTAGASGAAAGDAIHLWHGDAKNRQYRDKLILLREFQPSRHVRQSFGCLEWTPEAHAEIPEIIAGLAGNFESRREDG